MTLSNNNWKEISTANPCISNVFCADPTAIEYEGRLYVYGTNDHEQYLNAPKNTYEKIKSLVCFSTDDMANWTYHGEINVEKTAPWIMNSWAPSICSRVEDDGKTHFYMYFSNNGIGVGVITATSPLEPWFSPLNHSLIENGMKGLENCPNPFDPGVCIDDEGTGFLGFGAGIGTEGTKAMPGSARIVKLGKDMVSLDSDFVRIDAPYNFEASEMNFINGTYVYTYNTSWEERTEWPYSDIEKAPACSMSYFTSKTPLKTESWVYRGHYFKNPGEMGLNYGNNHTHLHKYGGKWYLFYHTQTLQEKSPTKGGFRSICVDEIEVDEQNVKIFETTGTRKGVKAIKNLDGYSKILGTTMFSSAGIWYSNIQDAEKITAKATEEGAWIFVKNVDFGDGADSITAEIKGSGTVQILTENAKNVIAAFTAKNEFSRQNQKFVQKISGVHDIWIAFSDKDTEIRSWNLEK